MRTISNPCIFRENIKNKFSTITSSSLGINIEIGIFNYTIKESDRLNIIKQWTNPFFVLIYINRFKAIYSSIQKSPYFQNFIIDNQKNPDIIATLTQYEMNPDKWKEIIQTQKIKNENTYDKCLSLSSEFTCKKCKS